MFENLFAHCIERLPDDASALRRALPTHGGVYLLTDDHDQPVQLAACESLRAVLAGRLDPDRPAGASRRADLRAVARRIRYQPTFSQFETALTFLRIARRLYPNNYRDLCTLRPAWFARVDPDDHLPRFVVAKYLAANSPGTTIGPFPTRAQAAAFIEQLVDLFDLCRDYPILEQTPGGAACSYFDMGRCPAPCNGSITLDAYRHSVAQAARFAAGDREESLAAWTKEMQAAATRQDYESAGRLKSRIDRAVKLDGPYRDLVTDMRRFRYLVVQRGGGRSKVKPFFVHGGSISAGQPVPLRKLDGVVESWCRSATEPP